ncbi:hypothetical protein JZ751_012216, partial [Albula glossodonta]
MGMALAGPSLRAPRSRSPDRTSQFTAGGESPFDLLMREGPTRLNALSDSRAVRFHYCDFHLSSVIDSRGDCASNLMDVSGAGLICFPRNQRHASLPENL